MTSYAQQNQLFLSRSDGTFVEVSDTSGEALLATKVSRGAAVEDFDNDRDLDLLITNSNQAPDVLRNDGAHGNRWVTLELRGTRVNRDAIGARVTLCAGDATQIREVRSGASYPCHADMRLHFGLGSATVTDSIEVRWPGGDIERHERVGVDKFWVVREGKGLAVGL